MRHLATRLPKKWPSSQRDRRRHSADDGAGHPTKQQPVWPVHDGKLHFPRFPDTPVRVANERKERKVGMPLRIASIKRQQHKGMASRGYLPRTPLAGASLPNERRSHHSSAPVRIRSQTPPPRTSDSAILSRNPLSPMDLNGLPRIPPSPSLANVMTRSDEHEHEELDSNPVANAQDVL